MLTTKQLSFLGLMGRRPFDEHTFLDIKSASKEKSHSVLQQALRQFVAQDLVTTRKIGTSKLYKLNYDNDSVYLYLTLYNRQLISKPVAVSIKRIQQELEKKHYWYALVIFGSYAQGMASPQSDVDVAVLVPDGAKKEACIAVNVAKNKTPLTIDAHVFGCLEFGEMLRAEYDNVCKHIATKNLPVYNVSVFYKLLVHAQR